METPRLHTLTLVLAGCATLAAFYAFARASNRALRSMLPLFLGLWCAVCLAHMWVGVVRAGYSIAEEMLVFLPAFGVPALAAILLARRSDP